VARVPNGTTPRSPPWKIASITLRSKPQFVPRGEIGRFRFPPMIVPQVEVRGGIDLELRALQWLYGTWLPRSGYVPDDQPGFEAWIGRPFAHGTEHFELYAQLPITRA
jgi:AraC family transcriptional regulator